MPLPGLRRSTPRIRPEKEDAGHPPPQQPPHLRPHPAVCYSAPRPARWPGGWCLGLWQAWLGAGASLAPSRWSAAGRSPCRGCSACNPKGRMGETDGQSSGQIPVGQGWSPALTLPTRSPRCAAREHEEAKPKRKQQACEANRIPPSPALACSSGGEGVSQEGSESGAREGPGAELRLGLPLGKTAQEAKNWTKMEFRERN